MPRRPAPALTAIPMPVFLAMAHARDDRRDRDRRQNSPANDGRTGYIVDYGR